MIGVLASPPPPAFAPALLLAASSCRADDTAVVTPTPVAQTVAAGRKLDAQAQDGARHNLAGVPEGLEVAVLGGGCFWGVQDLLRQIEGIVSTQVGYAGGATRSASYASVSSGLTGHAESVKVVFDATRLSYEQLLLWFFRIHDPTTLNRQGKDVGTQYRSVIFCQTAGQAKTAHAVRARAQASGRFDAPNHHADRRSEAVSRGGSAPPGLLAAAPGWVHLSLRQTVRSVAAAQREAVRWRTSLPGERAAGAQEPL